MVRNTVHYYWHDLGSADILMPINLIRNSINDFALQLLGTVDAQIAFTVCGRTQQLLHAVSRFIHYFKLHEYSIITVVTQNSQLGGFT